MTINMKLGAKDWSHLSLAAKMVEVQISIKTSPFLCAALQSSVTGARGKALQASKSPCTDSDWDQRHATAPGVSTAHFFVLGGEGDTQRDVGWITAF